MWAVRFVPISGSIFVDAIFDTRASALKVYKRAVKAREGLLDMTTDVCYISFTDDRPVEHHINPHPYALVLTEIKKPEPQKDVAGGLDWTFGPPSTMQ